MKLVFTLFDAKTESHSPFGLFKTVQEAKRTLVISLRGASDIPPAQFPEDFSLCCVGSFDETTRDNPYTVEALSIVGSAASILSEFTPVTRKDFENA